MVTHGSYRVKLKNVWKDFSNAIKYKYYYIQLYLSNRMVVDNGIKSFHEKISFYNMLCNSNVLIRKDSYLSGLGSFRCKVSV